MKCHQLGFYYIEDVVDFVEGLDDKLRSFIAQLFINFYLRNVLIFFPGFRILCYE